MSIQIAAIFTDPTSSPEIDVQGNILGTLTSTDIGPVISATITTKSPVFKIQMNNAAGIGIQILAKAATVYTQSGINASDVGAGSTNFLGYYATDVAGSTGFVGFEANLASGGATGFYSILVNSSASQNWGAYSAIGNITGAGNINGYYANVVNAGAGAGAAFGFYANVNGTTKNRGFFCDITNSSVTDCGFKSQLDSAAGSFLGFTFSDNVGNNGVSTGFFFQDLAASSGLRGFVAALKSSSSIPFKALVAGGSGLTLTNPISFYSAPYSDVAASSTATQVGSFISKFEGSFWTGAASALHNISIQLRASTATNLRRFLSFLDDVNGEFVSFDGLNSRVGINQLLPSSALHIGTAGTSNSGNTLVDRSVAQTVDKTTAESFRSDWYGSIGISGVENKFIGSLRSKVWYRNIVGVVNAFGGCVFDTIDNLVTPTQDNSTIIKGWGLWNAYVPATGAAQVGRYDAILGFFNDDAALNNVNNDAIVNGFGRIGAYTGGLGVANRGISIVSWQFDAALPYTQLEIGFDGFTKNYLKYGGTNTVFNGVVFEANAMAFGTKSGGKIFIGDNLANTVDITVKPTTGNITFTDIDTVTISNSNPADTYPITNSAPTVLDRVTSTLAGAWNAAFRMWNTGTAVVGTQFFNSNSLFARGSGWNAGAAAARNVDYSFLVQGTNSSTSNLLIQKQVSTDDGAPVSLFTLNQAGNGVFIGNLALQVGTGFSGIFTHAITASRTWTLPDFTGNALVSQNSNTRASTICLTSTGGTNLVTSTFYFVNGVDTTGSVTEANRQAEMTRAATARNLRVTVAVAPGGITSWTVTVRKNGVDTALKVTISGASVAAQDSADAITLAAGDLIDYSVTTSGVPAASGNVRISMDLDN